MLNRYKKIIISTTIIAIAAFYLLTIREGQLWGDFSQYIQHAKNIAENKSYGNTCYIFNPSLPWGSKSYPPILPLLLAPVYKLFGLNLTIMKIEIILFFISALVVIYLLFARSIPFHYLLSIIALIGFNPYLWDFKENIVSDVPFLFFSCLCLYWINKVYDSKNFNVGTHDAIRSSLLSACLLYLAFGTRILGITLLASLVIYDIVRLRRPSIFLIKVIIFFSILVAVQQIIISSFPTYSKEFYFSFKAIFTNIKSYAIGLALLWHNGYFAPPTIVFSIYLFGLALFGYIGRVREKWSSPLELTIFEFYLPIYIVTLILWSPYSGGMRYLIPVIPLYLFYGFKGIEKITNNSRIFFILLIIGSGSSYIARYTTMNYGRIDGVTNKECTELFNYIKEKTDSTDVFIFTRPRVLSLYTERKSAISPFMGEDEEIWQYLKKINATHIIVGAEYLTLGEAKAFGIDQKYIIPFIKRYEDKFYLTYSNSGFNVYRIANTGF